MTEQEYREAHEKFIKQLNALDRHYAPDAPESPEEAAWNEKRINEINLPSPYGKTIRPLLKQEVLHEENVPSTVPFRE